MIQENLKLGLIGLGNMGQNHLRVLAMLKGVDIAFVADHDANLASRSAAAYGVTAVTDVQAALDGVDAVVICTPTITHADYIKMAAAKVANIFVEKPVAATLAEAREVERLVNENDLNLQVGFIERFNPAVQSLRRVLEQTERIISIDFTRTNKLSARITDVDVVSDLMIHDIDLALHINGPATQVAAHGYCTGDMIDFASALITHANGQFSRIQASRVTDKKIRHIACTCVDMFVDCDLLRKEIFINRQSNISYDTVLPYSISSQQEAVAVTPQEALLSELQAFVASCRDPRLGVRPDVRAGVTAMEICEQIQKDVFQK
ncbi:Gfo/Idh/MocA family oxidoreductase [Rhodobacteraceae bacterium XHP0102]|nr:Gfo/Idh/MocA family oxidoreductase [Rhodobacteraceae bacterium XHP0102]